LHGPEKGQIFLWRNRGATTENGGSR
jgi:hypothetical protein